MNDPSARACRPSMCEENDMDPLALTKSVLLMFPNISEEFIDELLQANEFDICLTVDMLHELNSQNMLHGDAIMGFPTFPDVKKFHGNLVCIFLFFFFFFFILFPFTICTIQLLAIFFPVTIVHTYAVLHKGEGNFSKKKGEGKAYTVCAL